MKPALPAPALLVISDRGRAGDLIEAATLAFRGGCRHLMLREKDIDTIALAEIGARLRVAAQPFGAMVVVNGDVDAAMAAGLQGVHLPQGHSVRAARSAIGEDGLIGVSAHSMAEAVAAEAQGADYITISPVFESASKPGYGPALGPAGLAPIARAVSLPVYALAGVSAENAADCLAAGAAGIAVMGGVMGAVDPEQAVRELIAAIEFFV